MASKKTRGTATAVGLLEIVQALFIYGKFDKNSDIYNWTWFQVFTPVWIAIGLFVFLFLMVILYHFIMTVGRKDEE